MAHKQNEPEDTRDKLLAAAKRIFAEKGYGGATVKEIADEAGVNISLISYHFQGKEGLLRSCLEAFGQDRLRDAQSILTAPDSAEDMRAKLRLWADQFLRCHIDEGDVCTILHRENVCSQKFLWEVFETTFLKAFDSVVKFLEAGKKRGFVKKETDPTLATGMLYGALIHVGNSQEVQKKWLGISIEDEKFRKHVTEQFLNVLLHGIA